MQSVLACNGAKPQHCKHTQCIVAGCCSCHAPRALDRTRCKPEARAAGRLWPLQPFLAHLRAVAHARQLHVLLRQAVGKRSHTRVAEGWRSTEHAQAVLLASTICCASPVLRSKEHAQECWVPPTSVAQQSTCTQVPNYRCPHNAASPLHLPTNQPINQPTTSILHPPTPHLHSGMLGQLSAPLHLLPRVLLAPQNAHRHSHLLWGAVGDKGQ